MYKKVETPKDITTEFYLQDITEEKALLSKTECPTGCRKARRTTLAVRKKVDAAPVTWEYYVNGTEREAKLSNLNHNGTITTNEIEFYLYDHLGNTRIVYEPVQISFLPYVKIKYAADYFPYGKVLREYVGTNSGDAEKYLTTQHERDLETGLDYRGARYYDSDIARFLSLDPHATKYPSLSPYNYVGGMPTIAIDPDGKDYILTSTVTKNEKTGLTTHNVSIQATYYVVDARKTKTGTVNLGTGFSERGTSFESKIVGGTKVNQTIVDINVRYVYASSLSEIPEGQNAMFIVDDAAQNGRESNPIGWGEIPGNKATVEYSSDINIMKNTAIHEIGHNFGMNHRKTGAMFHSVSSANKYGYPTVYDEMHWYQMTSTGKFHQNVSDKSERSNASLKKWLDNTTDGGYNKEAIQKK